MNTIGNLSKECLYKILSSANQSITIVEYESPEQPLIYVNDNFVEITGYSFEEAVGRNCRFLQGKDTSKDAASAIKKSLDEFKSCCVDILNYRKSGTPFWNRLSLYPVIDPENRKKYFIGIQSDVTLEIEAKRKLESNVEDCLSEVSLTKDALSHIAHDIKTGLSTSVSIMDLINIDIDQLSKDDLEDYFKLIANSSNRMIDIVDGLLEYSRYKNGIVTPILSLFNVKESLEKEIEFFKSNLKNKNIRTVCSIDSVTINSDQSVFETIFRNIFSNAIKYSAKNDEIKLTVSSKDEFININLEDNGKGVDEKTLNILNKQLPISSALGTEGEVGHGMGMSIIFKMINSLEGNIKFENSKNDGLLVKIQIPTNSKT